MSLNFQQRLDIIEQQSHALVGFGRGVEREGLRVKPDGKLSEASHPYAFGSALCHDSITTDFSESLLEFITPVAKGVDQLFDYLNDIHHYAAMHLENDETLWPISMPCFVESQDNIELAQYGNSNTGKMKTAYRQGLKNRYGSMMQIIAGVHYNFSLPASFWDTWREIHQSSLTGHAAQSAGYLGLVRNYFRYGWVIPYLFGASPALCQSFLQGKETKLDFKKVGKGTIYLPYATSLRLSDLGYTNSSQSSLNICYNSVDNYIDSVRQALHKKAPEFKELGVKDGDKYIQLNDNVLQIENELYASIRPKRVQKTGETPSQALHARGVEYIEIRSLDVNPFSKVGITEEQVNFLDLFLTWCAIKPSEDISATESKHFAGNLSAIVTEGRNPDLTLEIDGRTLSVAQWGEWITNELKALAVVLDKSGNEERYKQAIEHIAPRFNAPELTSSARILDKIISADSDNGPLALALSKEYKQALIDQPYQIWSDQYFEDQKESSQIKQREIELADKLNFDDYLISYFKNAEKV
ncbi:glutamate--cysteine ligase [Psychromonas sp. psych-6C06]|uniref:glutamate--cysteine ligase n=1 Tax=Psychromonas sp. psych-6C06 TaxID=2058089 RepID=UPI000C325C54|nr:glutamate--cysteine ligase [Psychromonas sp. psych-6C06]PKF60216.1 glutamate--cysteine ligase [Psychromonas sp. psych-6C06]